MRLLALVLLLATLVPTGSASTEQCLPAGAPVACVLAGGESSGTCDDRGYRWNGVVLTAAAGDASANARVENACDWTGNSRRLGGEASASAPLAEERSASLWWTSLNGTECYLTREVDGQDRTWSCPFGMRPPRPPIVLP